MIADVRFKVRMRLRAFIQGMGESFAADPELRHTLRQASEDKRISATLKMSWLKKLAEEFPGCQIDCTPQRIYIRLPANYPAAAVPIHEPYPSAFRPALFGTPGTPDF